VSWAPVSKEPRQKTRANKRQDKQRRMRELLLQRKREAKDTQFLDRKLARTVRRTESAWKGCSPDRLEDLTR
jgi:hypothetical protein